MLDRLVILLLDRLTTQVEHFAVVGGWLWESAEEGLHLAIHEGVDVFNTT